MSKYDFKLDMKSDNSLSVILKNIKPGSTVLEVGPAHGRMTKYLKEELKCEVDIVEIDEEAGKVASEWCRNAFLGDQGNIESDYLWHHILHELQYDYVIFADVLEHLINPEKVLARSKSLLSENGSVWISIPNIAYNGVIIELMNDQFTYRDVGLLDNTHLRFFTMNSLDKMVKKCGFKISFEHNLQNKVSLSEFKDAYTKVPPQIASFLKFRQGGEVYQMIWELKANG
jgi:O-antigen biosynthesis protein